MVMVSNRRNYKIGKNELVVEAGWSEEHGCMDSKGDKTYLIK